MKIIAFLMFLFVTSIANAAPVTLLVGFPPGGGNYIVAQIVAEAYEKLGHNTIIETKAGAGGIVGMNYCNEQVTNKNMICIVSQAQYVYSLDTPQILKYDPEKITYVKMLAGSPLVLVANANNKKTVSNIIKDLTSTVDKKPVRFAIAGTGNKVMTHEFLRLTNATNFVEAEYKGAGDVIKDIAGDHVDYMIVPYSVTVGKESLIRIVANLGSHFNNSALRNIESLQKTIPGLPINNASFGVVLGESATPEHTDFFYTLTTEIIKDKVVIDKLHAQGMFVFDSNLTKQDFKKQSLKEIQEFKKWKNK
jgi:tripartite-type tricarboxylate transporter receptor subunit TctC